MWVFGGPGSGKSHLSAWTIEYLLALYGEYHFQPAGVSVAYFFVREDEQQLQDPNTILKTLAWQIAERDPAFRRHAVDVCSSKQKIISAAQIWRNLFVAFYRSIANVDRSTMLVIDGLDEAPKTARSTLLGFFKSLLSEGADSTRPHIQVAVVGRVTLKGDMDFEREEKFIEVSRDKNQEDIDRYIEDRLSRINIIKRLVELDRLEADRFPKKQTKPQAPLARKRLKSKISSYADGVFLWAKLLLDQIHDKDYRDVETILSRPPSSLESMIKQVYERLSAEEEDLEPIKKLLTWTAYAQRPLLFGEIELILSLPSRAPNLLLWDKFKGKFASVFELTEPEHNQSGPNEASEQDRDPVTQTPNVADEIEAQQKETGGQDRTQAEDNHDENSHDDQDEWDRSSEESHVQSEHESGNSEFKLLDDVEMDRGLDALAAGDLLSVAGDHIHAYADWQSKTRITFSHLQFREFLVAKKQRDPILLDIDVERSHLEITLTCLKLLQYGFHAQKNSKYLIDYPCRFFVRHLELVDPSAVKEQDRYDVVRGLYWLFHEDGGIGSLINAPIDMDSELWDDYWTTWLATNTHSNSVREWFAAGMELSQWFDEAALVWMEAASKSTRVLFEPWVQKLARMWLMKSGLDDEWYISGIEHFAWLMHGLTSIVSLLLCSLRAVS